MKLLLNLVLALVSVNLVKCHSLSEYERTIDYLKSYGYIETKSQNLIEEDSKNNLEEFLEALKKLQKHGNIPITGKIDKSTLTLMKTLRCGVSDNFPRAHKNRQKRFVLANTKWQKLHITWSFDDKNGRFSHVSSKIRRGISEALKIWQKQSTLTFKETDSLNDADILISFEPEDHTNVDPYVFRPQTLAHAFTPGSGLGGDVHFRIDLDWDFDVLFDQQPSDDKVSFFAVALHELGHSLGLGHTDDKTAVMYEFYSMNTATLSLDDIQGIQHIYGAPYKPQIHSSDESTTSKVETAMPDKCNMSYDAIALIRRELFIFHGKFMWRPEMGEEAMEIRHMWSALPENLQRVDAVYEKSDGKILFFIGNEIYIFNVTNLVDKIRLYHIGMDWSVKKIDAIFRWSYNKRTYIFSGDEFWRFDEKTNRVEKNYPKIISKTFRDVFSIDTGFSYEDKLYFFKNEFFYEFKDLQMRMKRMKPQYSAEKFMKCSVPKLISVEHNNHIQDFIIVDEEYDEDVKNFEESEMSENRGIEIKIQSFLIALVIIKIILMQ